MRQERKHLLRQCPGSVESARSALRRRHCPERQRLNCEAHTSVLLVGMGFCMGFASHPEKSQRPIYGQKVAKNKDLPPVSEETGGKSWSCWADSNRRPHPYQWRKDTQAPNFTDSKSVYLCATITYSFIFVNLVSGKNSLYNSSRVFTMIHVGDKKCPNCGQPLEYRDTVRRIVRTKGRLTKRAYIRRLRCTGCGSIHREIPKFIFPYKQYEAEIIRGVIEGLITSDTLGYEDYPCEATMRVWIAQNLQGLL